jgi:iron-sulfur cluster repair protein YtfE (RIC family)
MDQATEDWTVSVSGPITREIVDHSHDGFLTALNAMAGLPSLVAQFEAGRKAAASAFAHFESHMLPHHATEEQILFPAVIRGARTDAERVQVQS